MRLAILVIMELFEENQEFLLVSPKDTSNLRRLVRVRDKHLEKVNTPVRTISKYPP